ncbi:nitrate reductase [Microvirga lotononidis]|uniref:Putative anaerobic dehydrogenase n=1 Tax=Microvirga lotononidis TaxID=864069 RepID=I4YRW6_9HYPH|nr:nitrate reductase [Microvirga lotononidis]EIM26708.1 putative anaerobic dehydrogenase [Microvirga lotononidis]WQO31626.1 molybdopterin-dependent oxidoreductase [Microvirga lotononidis]
MASGAPTRTTCPYCGVGCGVVATPQEDGSVAIRGDENHPANLGRLCSKGAALGETLSLDDRLLYPEIEGHRTGWDKALDLVARRFMETMAEYGPEAVAIYGSGQLLTEDYYVANKLMKGFIGAANIDTNSRLCMASSVAGHIRAFGSDTVPGTYEDLEEADLVVLVGSNMTWCHPVLFQRLLAARERRGTRIVVIDPRRTVTAEAADLHLAIAPNSDVALFAGLLDHLDRMGFRDAEYVERHTSGLDDALAAAQDCGFPRALEATRLPAEKLREFYTLWSRSERVVTAYSQGVNQSVVGTDKVNAIINCHLFTGRIGRPGMGPFSLTGQPNAMGGREVGGLANMLTAHLDINSASHRELVRSFWNSPGLATRPGLKAVDLFRAVGEGRIKAIWIMGTNPADSLPDADAIQKALRACPFVVVSDVTRTDTTRHAHVLLPAAAWAEKSGTVTNSERRISRQRSFLKAPGEARPDWRIICDVAARMGFAEAFDFQSPAEIFREHAALSGVANGGSRDFDIAACAELTGSAYDTLAPFQWPRRQGAPLDNTTTRFFAEGGFYTPDQRGRFVPTPVTEQAVSPDFPLILNTGRIRDQWHTMTRTAKTPRLMSHYAESFCEIHPEDAEDSGIEPATLARIVSPQGTAVVRALVTERQRKGSIFVPMHWTDQQTAQGRIGAAVLPAVDPVSGQPGLKSSGARIEPFDAAWYGFAVLRNRPATIPADYWALARAEGGWRIELAGAEPVEDWAAYAADLIGSGEGLETLSYSDQDQASFRLATFSGDALLGALFVSPQPVAVSRTWAVEHLTASDIRGIERLRLLSGRPGADQADPGPIVCACFSVGANQIAAAVENGAASVDAVGDALRAGTNCGSCRVEIRRLIDAAALKKAV